MTTDIFIESYFKYTPSSSNSKQTRRFPISAKNSVSNPEEADALGLTPIVSESPPVLVNVFMQTYKLKKGRKHCKDKSPARQELPKPREALELVKD
jgi:hypothetical protein